MERAFGFAFNTTTGVLLPSPTVTVYLSQTLTLATIFSDDGVTPLANPFTGSSTAYWFFYAANGDYDIKIEAVGAPTYTLGDYSLGGGGGGGGAPGGANTNIQYNAAGTFGGDANFTWDSTNNRLGLTGGTVATDNSTNIVRVSGTMPAVPSQLVQGIVFDITTAGSGTQSQEGLVLNFNPGFTGTGGTHALAVINTTNSTNTTAVYGADVGIYGNAKNVGAPPEGQRKVGVVGDGRDASIQTIGTVGYGMTTAGTARTFGVVGDAQIVSGASGVGGLFRVMPHPGSVPAPPSSVSAGLIVDNTSTTHPIARFQNNGVDQVTINDTCDGTQQYFRVIGVLPSGGGTSRIGTLVDINSAGSANVFQAASWVSLSPGYTGPNNAVGIYGETSAQSTSLQYGNMGLEGFAYGVTAGSNRGIHAEAYNGDLNVGVSGVSPDVVKANSTHIGVQGLAKNTGASGIEIGGIFALGTGTINSPPTYTSAALVADNGSTTNPIALFRNNGVTQVTIGDGVAADNTTHLLEVNGTLPSVTTADVTGIQFIVTGAGSTANNQDAMGLYFNAGYSGNVSTAGLYVENTNAGTANQLAGLLGNHGVSTFVSSTTAGANIGLSSWVDGGSPSVAVLGRAAGSKNNASFVGGYFFARNTAGTNPVQVGAYVGLRDVTDPTFSSCALQVDNGAETSPIARFQNAGVDQVKIGDGVPNDNSQHFLEVVGTLPSSPSTAVEGIKTNITSAGSASQEQYGWIHAFNAGYTGSSSTYGLYVPSFVAGTNSASGGLGGGNAAVWAETGATTTGNNTGIFGRAYLGNNNFGVSGSAITAKNNATNIGVTGIARNTGTTPIEIGGYFGLNTSTPTFESAALVADNAGVAAPIFLARDNGTTVYSVQDGGHVYAKMGTKTLTEGAATGFARVSVPSGTTVAGTLEYAIEANDGTDFQVRSGIIPFNAYNKAGTEVGSFVTPDAGNETFAASAGTLSNAFTFPNNAADTLDLSANATSSLTQTTLRINYTIRMYSNAIVAVTPL